MILGTGAKISDNASEVLSEVHLPLIVLGGLLLCLCVSGWASCQYQSKTTGGAYYDACALNTTIGAKKYRACNGYYCSQVIDCSGANHCAPEPPTLETIPESPGSPAHNCRISAYVCTTQAEADSAYCSNNPGAEGCAVVSDTLIFACSESMVNGQAVATIYRLSCKATNGEVTECNGKQNIDIPTDGQPVKQMQGTCAQNGLNVGPFGGASPQDSTQLPNGANADCFAITGSTCHMRDKVSGNTFTCGCDGSCNVAIQNLMAGNADCTNPYPQPNSSSDSLSFPLSSPSSSPSSGGSSSPSSGGSGEGSSASGGEGGNSSSDFEYDYTAVLEAIRANTQYTGNEVNDLNGKANTANEYLRQIANKDFSPVVNVGGPSITLNADTAKAPAQILGLLNEKMSGGEPNSNDTAGTGSRLDGYLSSIDSIVGEGTPDMSDSIGNAVRGVNNAYNALKDSLGNSAWSDSVTKWQGQLTNNGTLSGSGSDNCPAVLTRKWNLSLGTVTTQVGPLGKYLCDPIFGGVTGWALARILLRTLVSIFCMIWLFKAVMGIDGGNNDED